MIDRNERERRVACFVLPVRDGQVLLARHTYAYSDVWAMIGGMAEIGERVDVAARREVLEETGLTVTTDRLVAVLDRDDLLVIVFAGEVVGGTETRQESEIAELRWLGLRELEDDNVFDLVRQLAPDLEAADGGLRQVQVAFPDMSRPGWASASSEG